MKAPKKTVIAAASLAIVAGAFIAPNLPSLAGTPTAASPIIDKDFEISLRKFLAKRFFKRIDATDEQKEKLSKIMEETQEETRPDREELRQKARALAEMMQDSKSSDDDIKAKVKELRALHEKVQDRRLTALLAARKILTEEQKQKIHERLKNLVSQEGPRTRRLGHLIRSNGAFSDI